MQNYVDSAGTKLYSHNTSFSIIGCSNIGSTKSDGSSSGGVAGYIGNAMSYAGISSENIANSIKNEVAVKYCFNAGNVSGNGAKGGVVTTIYNCIGTNGYDGQDPLKPIRGGKGDVDIYCNYNAGSLSNLTGTTIASVVANFYVFPYSINCYSNGVFSNNYNICSVISTSSSGVIGAMLGNAGFNGSALVLDNSSIIISKNYNYSTEISGGSANHRGMVGRFYDTASSVTFSNNYSAYKRDDNNNVHGSNPTTNGANVGEAKKI